MYIPSIGPKDLIVTDRTIELFNKRKTLLLALAEIDNELNDIRTEQINEGKIKAPRFESLNNAPEFREINLNTHRAFPCKCGVVFPSYLERETHLSNTTNHACARDGEILGFKHIHRDETKVGNKIITRKPVKPTLTDDDEFC